MDKMSDWTFEPYRREMCGIWDEFVEHSRNATFLHKRDYMDYHSDRFHDHSLMAMKKGRLAALLPADILTSTDDRSPAGTDSLRSHGGLTYGGWLLPARHLDSADFMEMWSAWLDYCRASGIGSIDYRPVPAIYHRAPSGDDIYALWRCGAQMTECNLSAAIDLDADPGPDQMRRRHLRKSATLATEITREPEPAAFHAMLTDCLRERHDASPVHTAAELATLAARFPDNIQISTIRLDGVPAAGVCLFKTARVAHCQYIATTPEGRRLNLLTPLFVDLIEEARAEGRRYFDFGTSNEDHGLHLNTGLIRQKDSYGASGTPYPRYTITLSQK